jgi:hypothetical protein
MDLVQLVFAAMITCTPRNLVVKQTDVKQTTPYPLLPP